VEKFVKGEKAKKGCACESKDETRNKAKGKSA